VSVTAASLSASSSSSAETVTLCSVFQMVAVKVRLSGLTVRSVSAWPVMATVTVAEGSIESFTV